MDAIVTRDPLEFQRISQRVITAFNPKREVIRNARHLRNIIMKGMEATGSYRSKGFLAGGGPELAVEKAKEGERAFQVLLGWRRPKKRIIRLKPAAYKWEISRLKKQLGEYEWSIIRTRHELRKLGYKLKPYKASRIRRLEKEFLKEIGWQEQSNGNPANTKKYWWKE